VFHNTSVIIQINKLLIEQALQQALEFMGRPFQTTHSISSKAYASKS